MYSSAAICHVMQSVSDTGRHTHRLSYLIMEFSTATTLSRTVTHIQSNISIRHYDCIVLCKTNTDCGLHLLLQQPYVKEALVIGDVLESGGKQSSPELWCVSFAALIILTNGMMVTRMNRNKVQALATENPLVADEYKTKPQRR